MGEISNTTRTRKGNKYDKYRSFDRWVDEYAEAHNMSVEDTLKLAMFRLENIPYHKE